MQEQREDKRTSKIMDVIISPQPIREGMLETLATCKNISPTGIQLELTNRYQTGELLHLRCFSNTKNTYIDVMCEVIWENQTDEALYNLGLKFLNLSSADYETLLAF